jgi:hypothetical protein
MPSPARSGEARRFDAHEHTPMHSAGTAISPETRTSFGAPRPPASNASVPCCAFIGASPGRCPSLGHPCPRTRRHSRPRARRGRARGALRQPTGGRPGCRSAVPHRRGRHKCTRRYRPLRGASDPSNIGDDAIIGNTTTIGVVGRCGSIDWCAPRIDSGAVFAAFLDEAGTIRMLEALMPRSHSSSRVRPCPVSLVSALRGLRDV